MNLIEVNDLLADQTTAKSVAPGLLSLLRELGKRARIAGKAQEGTFGSARIIVDRRGRIDVQVVDF